MLDGVDAMMGALVIIWGTAFVSLKVLGEDLDAFQIVWYRFVPFIIAFGVWMAVWKRPQLRAISGKDWAWFAVLGALGVLGYHLPVNVALQPDTGVTAAAGAILVATTPLWALLTAVLSGQERLGPRRLTGSVIAFAGVVIVVLMGTGKADFGVAARASFILVAAVLWSTYSVLARPLIARHGGMMTTGVAFTLGTLYLLPYGIATGIEPLTALDTRQWIWLAYLSILATVGGYIIWNQALVRRTASEVTAFIYLIPVVATLAGAIILSERVTLWFALGAVMVLYGVWLINQARLRAARFAAANA